MADDENSEKEASSAGQFKGFGVTVPLPKTFRAVDALLSAPLDYARDALQAYIDRKKLENLLRHTEAVREKLKARIPQNQNISVRQIELIDDWALSAASFGDENPELAAAWRAVLEKIQLRDDNAEEILLALRSLTPSDISLFTSLYRKASSVRMFARYYKYIITDEPRFKRLVSVGLVEDHTVFIDLIRGTMLACGTCLIVGLFSFEYLFHNNRLLLFPLDNKYAPAWYRQMAESFINIMPIVIVLIGILFLALILGTLFFKYVNRYSVTELGQLFLKSFEKYCP